MSSDTSKNVTTALHDEAHHILWEAKRRGIILRLLGAQAVRHHCPKFGFLLDKIGRGYFDLDFLILREQRPQLKNFFAEMGYTVDRQMLVAAEGTRYLFKSKTGTIVDVFVDSLDFCHRINLRERISLDYPTISLSDLLLSKLQIVEITDKDLQDVVVLLVEHEVAESDDAELLNAYYVSDLLAADWGFYYTVSQNLGVIKSFLSECIWLSTSNKKIVSERIGLLEKTIEAKEKSLAWKLRSKVGRHVTWYKQVNARDRVF